MDDRDQMDRRPPWIPWAVTSLALVIVAIVAYSLGAERETVAGAAETVRRVWVGGFRVSGSSSCCSGCSGVAGGCGGGAAAGLPDAGFSVTIAADGATGLEMARQKRPDLVVLDLGLPRLDGLEVARALRRESDVPIIMLTARVDETDRLHGFEVGADDYITKPFSPRELVARVSSVLRRARYDPELTSRFDVADLSVDATKMRVERNGKPIELTPTEFQLVAALARHPGRVFTRAQLLDAVRGTESNRSSAPSTRT